MNEVFNLNQVLWFAHRAKAAYHSSEDIRKQFSNVHTIDTIEGVDVQYFIEDIPEQNAQLIAIRGTENLTNVKDDAEFVKTKNEKLGVYVHQGFDEDAELIYASILPKINKDKKILLTGHSLGGAISTLLMMYFHVDRYLLGASVNFGQPKVTNSHGVDKYSDLPLLRVVNEEDLVPMVPPLNFLDSVHGAYKHLGLKLLLTSDKTHQLIDKDEAEKASVGSFWRSLGHHSLLDHKMDDYLLNIEGNLKAIGGQAKLT